MINYSKLNTERKEKVVLRGLIFKNIRKILHFTCDFESEKKV